MGFKLTVTGKDTIKLGVSIIRFVNVELSTPGDSKAKSSDAGATMWVTGKLHSTDMLSADDSETLKLFNWSSVPATSADAYRNVVVEVISAGKIFRKINFPNAFVVNYNERYNDNAGIGEFALVLRQRADKMADVKAEVGPDLEEALS